jgi:tetratricopeptide (TPR) repeat protein
MKALFFMLIVFSILGFREGPDVRKFKKQLAEERSDSARVKFLNLVAVKHLDNYPDSSEYYSKRALSLSESIPYYKGIIESLKNCGKACERQGKFYLALGYAKQAMLISQQHQNSRDHAEASIFAGIISYESGNDTEALEFLMKALKESEHLKENVLVARSLSNIGMIHEVREDHKNALKYYQKALRYAELADNKMGQGVCLTNIANVYLRVKDYKKSLAYYNRSIILREGLGDKNGMSYTITNIGLVYRAMKDYPEALEHLYRGMTFRKELHSPPLLMSSYIHLSKTFLEMNVYDSALYYAKLHLKSAESLEAKRNIKEGFDIFKQIYEQMGNYKMAYEYQGKYLASKEQLDNEEIKRKMLDIEANYESEKQLAEINLLKSLNLRSKVIRNIAFGVLIITFIFGGSIFYIQKKTHSKDKKLFEQRNTLSSMEESNRELREKYLQEKIDFKNKELTTNTLNLIQKNGIMTEIRESIQEILATSKDSNIKFGRLIKLIDYSFSLDKDWDEFKTYFDQVHTEFFTKLKERYPDLSTADFRLCALIKLKLSMKECATVLGISAESVKTARYRLRKKLNLNSEENLLDFITTF